jgi:hypothetical protein
LLGRQQFDELTEFASQEPPSLLNMLDEGMRLVLGDHANHAYPGVHAVGKREIDDAEFTSEWNRGFGAPQGHLLQAGTAPPGQYQRQCVTCQTADKSVSLIHGRYVMCLSVISKRPFTGSRFQ